MKKVLLLSFLLFFLVGCSNRSQSKVTNNLIKKYKNSSGYKIVGDLEITNNDEVYNYNVTSTYDKRNGFYKIVFVNKSNDFEQIILKNSDGVFLLSPSLNKSFKFNSNWPYNNSQLYLFETLINDIKSTNDLKFEFKDNKYIYYTNVNYPNNRKLVKQKIIFDEKLKPNMVCVYDKDNKVIMKYMINKFSLNPSFDKDYFTLNIEKNEDEDSNTEKTMALDDIVYPLFLPSGTKLVDEKKVDKDNGQRVIMTYDGEKSFLLVEETLDVFNDFMVIPSYGEPLQLMDTIGVMTDNSLSWSSGNIEYYLVSDVMGKDELIEIAQSIVGVSSLK